VQRNAGNARPNLRVKTILIGDYSQEYKIGYSPLHVAYGASFPCPTIGY